MNSPINSSMLGAAIGAAASVAGASASSQSPLAASLADQDWFAADTLSDGHLIEASAFGLGGNGLSIENAVEKIVSNLS